MAYTPPYGNAVNFQATGTSYTPPLGSAVNFEPTNTVWFEIPLTVALQGVQAHTGSASFAPVVLSVVGEQPITGVVRTQVALTVAGTLDIPQCAAVSLTDFIAVSASGFAAIMADVAVPVEISVSALGSAANTTGEGWFEIPMQVEADGVFTEPFAGTVSIPVEITVGGSGQVAPFGDASVEITISVAATGDHGVTGQASASLVSAAALGVVGRTGSASIPIVVSLAARGATGVSGSASLEVVRVTSLGELRGTVYGTASFVPIKIAALGFTPLPKFRKNAARVVQERRVLYVR